MSGHVHEDRRGLQGKNEDKQEPRMDENGKDVKGVPVAHPIARAANEEFYAREQGQDGTAGAQSAWDPYEVWRTRVKEPSIWTLGASASVGRGSRAPTSRGGRSS
jgi:hypothetical protein